MNSAIDGAAERIREIASHQSAVSWLSEYFDPKAAYAGELFNSCAPNEPDTIDASDLYAASLLSIEIDVRRARSILVQQRAEISRLLAEIPAELSISEAQPYPQGEVWEAATRLWELLRSGWTGSGDAWVIAGKILARKRPHLVPVADNIVVRVVGAPRGMFWTTVQRSFRDGTLEPVLDAHRAAVPAIPRLSSPKAIGDVSNLRLLDVILWRYGKDVGPGLP